MSSSSSAFDELMMRVVNTPLDLSSLGPFKIPPRSEFASEFDSLDPALVDFGFKIDGELGLDLNFCGCLDTKLKPTNLAQSFERNDFDSEEEEEEDVDNDTVSPKPLNNSFNGLDNNNNNDNDDDYFLNSYKNLYDLDDDLLGVIDADIDYDILNETKKTFAKIPNGVRGCEEFDREIKKVHFDNLSFDMIKMLVDKRMYMFSQQYMYNESLRKKYKYLNRPDRQAQIHKPEDKDKKKKKKKKAVFKFGNNNNSNNKKKKQLTMYHYFCKTN